MSQIYVSGPWSFASGVLQVVKSIKAKSRADKVVYSEKGTEYQFSKLEQSDYVVFVLDGFAWQQKLESRDQYISAGRKDLADNESKEILVLESFLPSEASPEEIISAIYTIITEKGWGDGETGPQIPKKCMGEAIKLVKAKLANVDGKLLADTIKTYLV